ncbi:MAG: GldG family protein, partial [Gammaproteobacteria bacterium]|nr:GldG family protein [Gammaproteobacteria bacterium]
MKIDKLIRRSLRVQHNLFLLLFITLLGLLAWLGQRYQFEVDLSATARHSLSPATINLLEEMPGPVSITAYARELEFSRSREAILHLLNKYQRHKADIQVQFVNPDNHPERVRDDNISVEGELVIQYQGRQQHLQGLSEQALNNTLLRLLRRGKQTIYVLTGHGERKLDSQANHDLGLFGQQLREHGLHVQSWNLGAQAALPEDAATLLLASPQTAYLPGEVRLLQAYIESGGNLLWLLEPEQLQGLDNLASSLGVDLIPGTIADPSAEQLGVANAAFTLISDYPDHPVTRNLDNITLLPLAAALDLAEAGQWQATPLLQSSAQSWSETGGLDRYVQFDPEEDIAGPLTTAYLLSRTGTGEVSETSPQHVAVIGDGDFLSNNYLGNGANLDLGLGLINWLGGEETLS